ncbi:MAG: hypothetical protein PHE54_00380 [Bacilli bacterium]|nr:hypothetical protein [Bacilli bacterium]
MIYGIQKYNLVKLEIIIDKKVVTMKNYIKIILKNTFIIIQVMRCRKRKNY